MSKNCTLANVLSFRFLSRNVQIISVLKRVPLGFFFNSISNLHVHKYKLLNTGHPDFKLLIAYIWRTHQDLTCDSLVNWQLLTVVIFVMWTFAVWATRMQSVAPQTNSESNIRPSMHQKAFLKKNHRRKSSYRPFS